jgi:hypothetical protein
MKKLVPLLAVLVLVVAIAALAGQMLWGDTIVWGASGDTESDYVVWGN